jgi:hypothetical protein
MLQRYYGDKGRCCDWWNLFLDGCGCGRADGPCRRIDYNCEIFFVSLRDDVWCVRWVWLFCVEKGKKLEWIRGRAVAEEEFLTGEICVSSKASIGMLAADGDESAMSALFLCESAWWMRAWLSIFNILCESRGWYLRPNHLILLAKKSVVSLLWWPPKWDLNYPNTTVFGWSIVNPTWDLISCRENTTPVVFEH